MNVEQLTASLETDPENGSLWWALASALSREGQTQRAADAWVRAGSLADRFHRPPALYNAGNELLRLGDNQGAALRYREALEHGFNDVAGLANWAIAESRNGAGESTNGPMTGSGIESVIEQTWSIASTPGAWEAFGRWLATEVGHLPSAVRALRNAQATDEDTDYGDWDAELAPLLLELGDAEAASEAWARARKLGHPKWPAMPCRIALARGEGPALLEAWRAQAGRETKRLPFMIELMFGIGEAREALEFGQRHLADSGTSKAAAISIREALARGLLDLGRAGEALECLDHIDSRARRFVVLRSRALVASDRKAEALQLLEPWHDRGAWAPPAVRLLRLVSSPVTLSLDTLAIDLIQPKPAWFHALV